MLLRREIRPEEVDASSALYIAPALASRVWNNMDQSVSHAGAQGTGAVIRRTLLAINGPYNSEQIPCGL